MRRCLCGPTGLGAENQRWLRSSPMVLRLTATLVSPVVARLDRRRVLCRARGARSLNISLQALPAASSPGDQLIWALRNTRSACGISAVKRPSGVVTAVRPPGLPFGFAG